ncbi:MAG: hypothetical protein DRP42_00285 [Tenericutes bacterium]|nr:MAG: hypothetical protein DRP42_00285 [Mycoplasmatota bacterium]
MYVKGTEVNPLTSFYKEQKTKQTITYLASNTHNYANTKAKDILIPIIRSSSEGRRLSYQQVYMLVYKFISQNSVLDTSFVLERKYKDLTQPEKIIVDVFVALLSTSEVIVVPDFISDVSQTDQLSILTLIASYIS